MPFYGKLSDVYGRKPLLMIGITLFLIGSALSGLSQEMWQLILFRGIQGLGAGALFPISLAVIGDLFTPAERGRYQGLFGAVFGISFIVGPALGGFLTDQVSWHWVFYVNIPIGFVSLYTIWRLLPTMKAKNASRNFDYLGGAVFTISMILLLVGLTNKQAADWTAPQVGGLIAAGLIGTVIFLVIEWFAKEPIVPLDLWRGRTYSSSMLSTFFVSFGFFGAIIFLPRWFQVVRHDSATASGYEIFPLLIGLIGSSIVAGLIVSRTGKYKALIIAALAIMVVGLIILSQTITTTVPTDDAVARHVHHGRRHRPHAVGLHDRRPERGAVLEARRRDVQPHVLPPDRRFGGPGDRRHRLRDRPQERAAGEVDAHRRTDRRDRSAGGGGTDHRGLPAERREPRPQQPDRRRPELRDCRSSRRCRRPSSRSSHRSRTRSTPRSTTRSATASRRRS